MISDGHAVSNEWCCVMVKSSNENMPAGEAAIDFGEKFTESSVFDKVYREGMDLVEETAAYLDSQGREDAKALDRNGALAYATESMRLTTRLMQLASWLLLQRAVKEGEMTPDEILQEKYRIKLEELGDGERLDGEPELPAALNDLIARSLRLHQRILRIDMMLRTETSKRSAPRNVVSDQRARLEAAFDPTHPRH